MTRIENLFLSAVLIVTFIIPFVIILTLVRITSKGPAIHWSKRVGLNNELFLMPKFRTMYLNTPNIATHLLYGSKEFITPIGRFLRVTSLDEIPQLWSIFIGKMNFVGPRPALFNQDDLVKLRTDYGIHKLKPGLTGLAQINGRDEISIPNKVKLDYQYMKSRSRLNDYGILFKTFFKAVSKDGVSH